MTDTIEATTTDQPVLSLNVHMGLNPATIDAAQVRCHLPVGYDHPIAAFEVGGLPLQTYQSDPLDVAAALRRLADRIDQATAEARADRREGSVDA